MQNQIKIGSIIEFEGKKLKVLTTKFWIPNQEGTFVVVNDNGHFFNFNINDLN